MISLDQKARLTQAILKAMEQEGVGRSCLGCNHFKEETEVCKLAGKRPPARVIVTGCPSWEELLPF